MRALLLAAVLFTGVGVGSLRAEEIHPTSTISLLNSCLAEHDDGANAFCLGYMIAGWDAATVSAAACPPEDLDASNMVHDVWAFLRAQAIADARTGENRPAGPQLTRAMAAAYPCKRADGQPPEFGKLPREALTSDRLRADCGPGDGGPLPILTGSLCIGFIKATAEAAVLSRLACPPKDFDPNKLIRGLFDVPDAKALPAVTRAAARAYPCARLHKT